MRLHCDSEHPDFHFAVPIGKVKVRLDGIERGHVIWADEEKRQAKLHKLDADGRVKRGKDGEPEVEHFYGAVGIFIEGDDGDQIRTLVEADQKRGDAVAAGMCGKLLKKPCEQKPYSSRCAHCGEIYKPAMLALSEPDSPKPSVTIAIDPATLDADSFGISGSGGSWEFAKGGFISKGKLEMRVGEGGVISGVGLGNVLIEGSKLAAGTITADLTKEMVATIHDEIIHTSYDAYRDAYVKNDGSIFLTAEAVQMVKGSGYWIDSAVANYPTNQEIIDAYKRGGTGAVIKLPGCTSAEIKHTNGGFDQLSVERSWAPKLIVPIMKQYRNAYPGGSFADREEALRKAMVNLTIAAKTALDNYVKAGGALTAAITAFGVTVENLKREFATHPANKQQALHSSNGCTAYDSSCSYCLDRRRKRPTTGRVVLPTIEEIVQAFEHGGRNEVMDMHGVSQCYVHDKFLNGSDNGDSHVIFKRTDGSSWKYRLHIPSGKVRELLHFDEATEFRTVAVRAALAAPYGNNVREPWMATRLVVPVQDYSSLEQRAAALADDHDDTWNYGSARRDELKALAIATATTHGKLAVKEVIQRMCGGGANLKDIPVGEIGAVIEELRALNKSGVKG